MTTQPVPVHLLTGFLGSGKTTLLSRILDYYQLQGKKPAVLMNELGEVNLDGMLVGEEVPMTEMLGGCICCTVRGDLSMELKTLIDEHQPDVILVESTGAANPLEVIDGLTDASLLTRAALASVVTVIDAGQLADRAERPTDKTFRLMKEQIRCGTYLILNKIDAAKSELSKLEALIREWNPSAPLIPAVRSEIDLSVFDKFSVAVQAPAATRSCDCGDAHHLSEAHQHHHTHEHVMVYTHYFEQPVDSQSFESFIHQLPSEVYRAKGILRFTDTIDPFMFQYAYKESDYMKIRPQGDVPSVVVFIGESFDKDELASRLSQL